ncbi:MULTISPECIES: LicD family protein [Lysinibacillus]|uniref:LicD family protein n=1 Tax=Lysinibacillus TaxID=400634 RepID=UPI000826E74B|nr:MULTISPECIES: LicD family protein [Lysinibacillus]MEC1305743.1 LicD family protein [Lysinibacillus capsici]OCX65246.1 hypothetical protein BFM98_06530 [Lysinibacillus sp. AR18-8]
MKIILFGASLGGQNFIKNYGNQYQILAIADNNEAIQGEFLEDILIISPSQIIEYDFEKVIVASMYVNSISKQLLNLGISKDKIEYASKISMKHVGAPFENQDILKKANQFIVSLTEILDGIPHYFTFGTLLGIARDGRLIPWDDDIDLAIFEEDIEKIKERLLENVEKLEDILTIEMYSREHHNGDVIAIMIDCYNNDEKLFNISLDTIFIEGDNARQDLNDTPLHYFIGKDEILFENIKINVPKNYLDYLTYTYGDWRTVRKDTSFADNTLSFKEPELRSSNVYFYKK